MPLHTRVNGEELDGQYPLVDPLYARDTHGLPRNPLLGT
jgi:hypothetical protein